jgi:hypothetical protein
VPSRPVQIPDREVEERGFVRYSRGFFRGDGVMPKRQWDRLQRQLQREERQREKDRKLSERVKKRLRDEERKRNIRCPPHDWVNKKIGQDRQQVCNRCGRVRR